MCNSSILFLTQKKSTFFSFQAEEIWYQIWKLIGGGNLFVTCDSSTHFSGLRCNISILLPFRIRWNSTTYWRATFLSFTPSSTHTKICGMHWKLPHRPGKIDLKFKTNDTKFICNSTFEIIFNKIDLKVEFTKLN